MAIEKFKLKEIFEMLHDEGNKQFYKHLVLITLDEDGYPCALSDENTKYGTSDYSMFEKSVRADFPAEVADQILNYEIYVDISDRPRLVAMDTTITYSVPGDEQEAKKILFVNAYPENEFEDTKRYKSGRCCPGGLFGF